MPQCPRESPSPVKSPLLLKLVAPRELSLLVGPEGLQATSCPRIGKNKQPSEDSGDPLISRCHSPRAQWLTLEEQRERERPGRARATSLGRRLRFRCHLNEREARCPSRSKGRRERQQINRADEQDVRARITAQHGPRAAGRSLHRRQAPRADQPPPARAWPPRRPVSPGPGDGAAEPGSRLCLSSGTLGKPWPPSLSFLCRKMG